MEVRSTLSRFPQTSNRAGQLQQVGDAPNRVFAYPIDVACKREWGLDVIEMMLDAGAAQQLVPVEGSADENEHQREFPILMAAKHGNAALMRLLLEKGGDEQVNLVDREGVCLPIQTH